MQIECQILRKISYESLDQIQRRIHSEILKGRPGKFLLAETEPVITLGLRQKREGLVGSRSQGIPMYQTDRGGLETYHGPGQWVLFPVFRLIDWPKHLHDVKKFMEFAAEETAQVVRKMGYEVHAKSGCEQGVWNHRNQKCASMGIRVRQGIVMHGFSLNVFRRSESFLGIKPCGLNVEPGFLLEDFGSSTDYEEKFLEVGKAWVKHLAKAGWGEYSNVLFT